MTLRVEGFPEEVDRMLGILGSVPGIALVRTSRIYENRDGKFIRRYVSVEFDQSVGHLRQKVASSQIQIGGADHD